MKNLMILGLVLTGFFAKAQDVSVAKNLFGAQLGLVSASFMYETKLQRKIALRAEVGLEMGFSTQEYNNPAIEDETSTLIVPYVSLEPRWYYGLDRRQKMGRNIQNNSSNYVSLLTSYQFNDAPVMNTGDFDVAPAFYIIPKYGIRRSFAKNFNYEFSAGVGYQYNVFSDNFGCDCDHSKVAVSLQARIGYDF